jgi:PTS system nitrogen regulatory IIA component
MPLDDILAADAIFSALKASNKKQALQELAAKAAVATGRA